MQNPLSLIYLIFSQHDRIFSTKMYEILNTLNFNTNKEISILITKPNVDHRWYGYSKDEKHCYLCEIWSRLKPSHNRIMG